MKQYFEKLSYFMFFLFSFIFLETIFRISTSGNFISAGFIYSSLFAIPFSIILYLICTSMKEKWSYIIALIFSIFIMIIFASQLIYFKFFRTYYTTFSASNGGQVFEFWKDILVVILKNLHIILLFTVPILLLVFFHKKFLYHIKLNLKFKGILILSLVLSHLLSVFTLSVAGKSTNSPYDLYFRSSYPVTSFEKLGLVTSMRLDLERVITNWQPIYEPSSELPTVVEIIDSNSDSDSTPSKNISDTDSTTSKPIVEEKIVAVPKEPTFNVMKIDFDSLISSEKDDSVKKMHEYFKNIQPTKQNEYTGMFKDYNLIFLTAESFSPYAVREDLTPTLYKMIHEGFYFSNFYNPIWGVSTSDGEYVACTGLIPKSGVWSMYHTKDNWMPFVMGNQFRKLGYETFAYHNHDFDFYRRDASHPNLGYTYKGRGNGLKVKATWPESDLEMMEKTLPEYLDMNQFHAYYMTVSGHMQYSFVGNSMSLKNRSYVEDLDLCDQSKAYIAANLELEHAMTYLLEELERSGKADNTLIVMSADHYPYGLEDSTFTELAGHELEKNFELFESPLIIYTKGMKPQRIDKTCSSLDIIPTISNLLGLEYDSRLLMGKDIFSDSDPLVIFLNKSFITDKVMYNAENNTAVNLTEHDLPEDYVKNYINIVRNKFYYSTQILDKDYYRKVIPK